MEEFNNEDKKTHIPSDAENTENSAPTNDVTSDNVKPDTTDDNVNFTNRIDLRK